MRVFASLLAISLALVAARADAAPRRVASLNLCTDELVLMLAAPEQIVSVTHLAQQPAETPLWRQARRYPRNDGSLLSVAPLRPDLVRDDGRRRRATGCASPSGSASRRSTCPSRRASPTSARASGGWRRRSAGREAGAALLRADRGADARARRAGAGDTIWLGGGGRTVSAHGPGGAMDGACRACGSGRCRATGSRSRPCWSGRPRCCCAATIARANIRPASAGSAHPAARRVRGARGRSPPTAGAGPAWGRC